MTRPAPSPVARQLRRVSRRLILQTLLDALAWFTAGALVVSAAWFVAQPYLLDSPPAWLRWTVAGGLGGGAILLAVALALYRRPAPVAAALFLDERFGLRERVTTFLMLAPEQEQSPAGQALLADVQERIAGLSVRSRFPLTVRWPAALVPVCGLLFALVAFFYEPSKSQATATREDDLAQALPNAAEIEQKLKKLEKKPREQKKAEVAKSEKLEQFDADMEKLTVKPRDTKKQVQDLVKEATALEDKMLNHQRAVAERARALKDQLQQMDRLSNKPEEKGPARELQKALDKGNLEKAKEEMDRLAKKMKDNELDKKEQEQLQKQLQGVKEKLDRLSEGKKEEERLEELIRKGGPDADKLQRELDELKQNNEKLKDNLKDLQDAAEQLERCQQCMKEGKNGEAGDCLRKAGEKLQKLGSDQEMQELADQLDRLQGCKRAMCQGLDGNPVPVPDSGRRPESKSGPTGQVDARSRADVTKGEMRIEGFEKGLNLKRPRKSSEIAGEIKQAAQEAPEAIDRLRIPKGVGDISKGYFDNLRGQSEKEAEGAKKP
jgi:hypothetical protein